MIRYNTIGVMSGTSLDGIDIAYCSLIKNENKWEYKIIDAHTYKYSIEWIKALSSAHKLSKTELVDLDKKYGLFLGKTINLFLKNKNYPVDLIASHGHTVFHNPKKKTTLQIGNGESIQLETHKTVVNDFRSLDVSLGGHGAPLVPIGDELLFRKYKYCINLGGFANISENSNGKRIAMDICPVNIVINNLAQKKGLEFDKDGVLGKSGKIASTLLNKLNNIKYYSLNPPKSLSREWLEEVFLPIIEKDNNSIKDIIRTIYEHIAIQIVNSTSSKDNAEILFTGGGSKNTFLIDLIRKKSGHSIIIPDEIIIDFKESLIFALLGVLRIRNEVNCLSSVTGAERDCSGGVVFKDH